MDEDFLNRFWAKVDRRGPDECWEWAASRHRQGYGSIRDHRSKGGKMTYAHRISWEIHNGPIPDSVDHHRACVMHKCDNPPCVNPSHLALGTHKENTADMIRKGRNTVKRGESHGGAKLNNFQARVIKHMTRTRVVTQKEIAVIFGVTVSTIGKISDGTQWNHTT